MTDVLDPIDELVARSKPHPELRRFHTFHRRHPEVLTFLVAEIRLRIAHGHTAYSFHSLWQYARWKLEVHAEPGGAYALNDHAAPFFARALVILYPELNGLCEFRQSTPDKVFGTRLDPAPAKAGRRKLQWADGTPLELGWRPTARLATVPAKRKPDIHARPARVA